MPPFKLADTTTTAVTAVQALSALTPPEDSGAKTADRYEWQAAMAAAHGLAMYLASLDENLIIPPNCNYRIVCEWHEDWIAVQGDDAELVSCKHRDLEVGAYTTITKIVNDGGLAHLFERWAAMAEKPTCKLVTSGAIAAGEARDIVAVAAYLRDRRRLETQALLTEDHLVILDKLRSTICMYQPGVKARWVGENGSLAVSEADQRLEVARFLSALRIDDKQPARDFIEHIAPAVYAQPVLDRLGIALAAAATWEAVIRLFRIRMRGKGPVPSGSLPLVVAYEPGSATDGLPEVARKIASRVVTMFDIDWAIRSAESLPAAYVAVARMPLLTRLAIKMDAGGCFDNSIERAEQLRLEYLDYWRSRSNADAAARVDRQRFERLLLRLSDDVGDPGSNAGRLFWRQLQSKVDAIPSPLLPVGMDADLALGGLCDLASRCKIWFSQRFDVEGKIDRLRIEHGIAS